MKYLVTWLLIFSVISAQAQTYIQGSNLIEVPTTTATAAATTTLTAASRKNQQFTGSTTQSVILPNATGLQQGRSFYISNQSTGSVTIKYNDASTARVLPTGSQAYLILENNATTNGVWDISGSSTVLGLGTFGSSPNASGASIAANILTLQPASTTNPGGVTAGAQSFAGIKTFTDQTLIQNGTVSLPGVAFDNAQSSGLYLSGTNEIAVAVNGVQALDFLKSTGGGNFGNIGMGTSASAADGTPLLIQRSQASAGVSANIANTHTDPNSKACWVTAADAGNSLGEVCSFTASSTVAAYVNAMTVRPNNAAAMLSLIGGDLSTGYVTTFTGGDYTSTGETVRFNADHTNQFMQSVTAPTSPAAGLKFYNNAGVFSSKTTGGVVSSFAGSNTGDVTIAAFGSSPTANAATISSQAITFQPADGTHPGAITSGAQTIGGAKTFSSAPVFSSVTASQALVVDSGKALSSVGYTNANTASNLVQRDGSGNFSAGTITATLTGTASGNTTYTANNHGVVISGSANAMTVIAPDASTTKAFISGGSSADPGWGTLALGGGGTGATTKAGAFDALSPMTTGGDLIYGGASGTGTRLANGSSGQVLTSAGSTSAPTWSAVAGTSFATQTAGTFFAGPTSGSAATPTFRALQAPTYQVFSSGTSQTYTTPAGVLYLKVRMVGGGGGGGSSGTGSWGSATAGGVTTFGNLTANNGAAGGQSGNVTGGTGVGGSGWTTIYTTTGGYGGGSSTNTGSGDTETSGGNGGNSPLGFGGAGGAYGTAGTAGTGAGSGGGGAGQGSGLVGQYSGGGGSGGGYIEARTSGAPSATYTYSVGAAGAGGSAGTNGFAGGAAQAGYIIVEEYYQ